MCPKHTRKKKRSFDKTGVESNFVTAEAPKPLIEKSLVSASMLSEIINQKYYMGVPLYRLKAEFKNMQINLSRQTMANWIITASNLVKPVYEQMHKELLKSEILHADETTLEVLDEPGRKPQAKSYMWVYTTGKSEEKNIILYDYQQGITDKKRINEIRQTTGKEAVAEFFKFCERTETLPKSLTGKAISYAINQKEKLMTYLEDEKLEMTNNRAERAIKSFIIRIWGRAFFYTFSKN